MIDKFDSNVIKLQKEIFDISHNINKVRSKNHRTMSNIVEKLRSISKDNPKKSNKGKYYFSAKNINQNLNEVNKKSKHSRHYYSNRIYAQDKLNAEKNHYKSNDDHFYNGSTTIKMDNSQNNLNISKNSLLKLNYDYENQKFDISNNKTIVSDSEINNESIKENDKEMMKTLIKENGNKNKLLNYCLQDVSSFQNSKNCFLNKTAEVMNNGRRSFNHHSSRTKINFQAKNSKKPMYESYKKNLYDQHRKTLTSKNNKINNDYNKDYKYGNYIRNDFEENKEDIFLNNNNFILGQFSNKNFKNTEIEKEIETRNRTDKQRSFSSNDYYSSYNKKIKNINNKKNNTNYFNENNKYPENENKHIKENNYSLSGKIDEKNFEVQPPRLSRILYKEKELIGSKHFPKKKINTFREKVGANSKNTIFEDNNGTKIKDEREIFGKMEEILSLLNANSMTEGIKKIKKLIKQEDFIHKIKKIYFVFNDYNKNFDLNDILFWVCYKNNNVNKKNNNNNIINNNYIDNNHKDYSTISNNSYNNKNSYNINDYTSKYENDINIRKNKNNNGNNAYEEYCKIIMKDYNLPDFKCFKGFLDDILSKNKRNKSFVFGVKKILCSNEFKRDDLVNTINNTNDIKIEPSSRTITNNKYYSNEFTLSNNNNNNNNYKKYSCKNTEDISRDIGYSQTISELTSEILNNQKGHIESNINYKRRKK